MIGLDTFRESTKYAVLFAIYRALFEDINWLAVWDHRENVLPVLLKDTQKYQLHAGLENISTKSSLLV